MGSIIASAFRDVSRDVRDMRHAEYMLCGGRGSTKSSFISIMIVLDEYIILQIKKNLT